MQIRYNGAEIFAPRLSGRVVDTELFIVDSPLAVAITDGVCCLTDPSGEAVNVELLDGVLRVAHKDPEDPKITAKTKNQKLILR